jgi:hypothetical protein
MSKQYPTKIDPHTGCEVLTTMGFFQKIADEEGEGKSGGELFTEMMEEIDADMRAEEQRIERDKDAALKTICDAIKEVDDEDSHGDPFELGFKPEDIVEVLEVKAAVGGGFRDSSTRMDVRLMLVDGTTRVVRYESWYSSGSWSEPPDGETNITVIEAGGQPVVHRLAEDKPGWPVCEACQTFGSTHMHGPLHFNPARYLVPISGDQGVTIDRLVFVCSPHHSRWRDSIDWKAPSVRLDQEGPTLPYVGRPQ